MNERGELILEIEKNERKYRFCMPFGAPFGESYDACHEFLERIAVMAKLAADNASRKTEIEDKTDLSGDSNVACSEALSKTDVDGKKEG